MMLLLVLAILSITVSCSKAAVFNPIITSVDSQCPDVNRCFISVHGSGFDSSGCQVNVYPGDWSSGQPVITLSPLGGCAGSILQVTIPSNIARTYPQINVNVNNMLYLNNWSNPYLVKLYDAVGHGKPVISNTNVSCSRLDKCIVVVTGNNFLQGNTIAIYAGDWNPTTPLVVLPATFLSLAEIMIAVPANLAQQYASINLLVNNPDGQHWSDPVLVSLR